MYRYAHQDLFTSYHNVAMSLYNITGCEEVGSDWDAVELFISAPPHNALSRTLYLQFLIHMFVLSVYAI